MRPNVTVHAPTPVPVQTVYAESSSVEQPVYQEAVATINAAIAAADTAAGTVFSPNNGNLDDNARPTVPYAVGDTWHDADTVRVCVTARPSGSYTASDWVNFSIFAQYIVAGVMMSAPEIVGGTVTGATLQTATSGARVVIRADEAEMVEFYSGNAGEAAPGFVEALNYSAERPSVVVRSGYLTGKTPAEIGLYSEIVGDVAYIDIPNNLVVWGKQTLDSEAAHTSNADPALLVGGRILCQNRIVLEDSVNATGRYFELYYDGTHLKYNNNGSTGTLV